MIFEFTILYPCYMVKKLPLLATCNKDSEEGKACEGTLRTVHSVTIRGEVLNLLFLATW